MAAAVFAAKETPEGMIHPGQRKKKPNQRVFISEDVYRELFSIIQ